MHDSLRELIQLYVETLYADLPADVQDRVAKDFTPNAWNCSSPDGRWLWAERSDAMREADEAVSADIISKHAYWFKLQGQILDTEREIADVLGASPGDAGSARLLALHAELAALYERWHKPDDLAARAQLAAEQAAIGQTSTVLDVSRAIEFLSESTGVTWTEAQFLSLASKSEIGLYAEVPPWTPMHVTQWEDLGLRERPFVRPGRAVLVMISPDQIQEAWVSGHASSSTWVSGEPFSVGTGYVYLESPFNFRRQDIRLTHVELMRVLKKWEESRQPIAPVHLPVTAGVQMSSPSIQPKSTTHKLRKNSLDAPIEKAVAKARSLATGAVYLELRELALSGVPPFLGTTDGDALCYTNDKNLPDKLTKDALAKRLKKHRLPGG